MNARQIIEAEVAPEPRPPRTLNFNRKDMRGHNTPLENAEFQLSFTKTNLRWLLGAPPHEREEGLIAQTKAAIAEIEAQIERLRKNPVPGNHP